MTRRYQMHSCLMCLPFLPAEHITPMFTSIIAMDAPVTPMPTLLHELLNYIQDLAPDSVVHF